MKGNTRFILGFGGVAILVGYLMWTGIAGSMVYFFTPNELMARVADDPTLHEVGVKVRGKIVRDSWEQGQGELLHTFRVYDIEDPSVQFDVEYRDLLPDTFNDHDDEIEVVVEGRYGEDGVFRASLVLTKCGSRYEAAPEDLANLS